MNQSRGPAPIAAPWTDTQVAALNRWQARGDEHPFTCGREDCRKPLVAQRDGWMCPEGHYRQAWAHAFMTRDAD